MCVCPGCCCACSWNYCWHAHTYNPPLPWYGCCCVPNTLSYTLFNACSNFNAVNFYPGIELVMGVADYGCVESDCTVGTKYVYSGTVLSQFTYTAPAGLHYYVWHGMGIKPNCGCEIYTNGTYCFIAIACGASDCCCTFTVSNLDAGRLCCNYAPGAIWIEGDSIWYVPKYGWKTCICNDGSCYGSTTSDRRGAIWVPSSANVNYLEYIDESCILRRTHNGDICGWCGCDGMPSTPGSTKSGFIWAECGFNGHALMFINCSGQKVRIGAGYLNGNEY